MKSLIDVCCWCHLQIIALNFLEMSWIIFIIIILYSMSWNHMLTDNKYHFCYLQMFLCENTIYSQRTMEDVLTHELIHAYDNCRIKYNPDDVRMLACTEVFFYL